MADSLLSVGLDVGTTTTQLIVSRLQVENQASAFAVPDMQITNRETVYRSQVYFTPLKGEDLVDGDGLRRLVMEEYRKAGIDRENVDTGAIIITGETSRRENARAVLDALSDHAGHFVVATAGPALESVLAARGAGADLLSQKTGKRVLHIDIGGGTSNLALVQDGNIVATGCLNIGGRLLKFTKGGAVSYVSEVLAGLTDLKPGDYPAPCQVEGIARILTTALEMAAGLRPATSLLDKLMTKEAPAWKIPEGEVLLSFSGGVADCIEKQHQPFAFGDMGPELGKAIRKSLLCRGNYVLGQETIRATVIGAGCHSTQLSGSTIFCRGVTLPVKNLPVAVFTAAEQQSDSLPQLIQERLRQKDESPVVLAFPGLEAPDYESLRSLARRIAQGARGQVLLICLEADMAKALGQCLGVLQPDCACLCIDRVRLQPDSFLDIGKPVGNALPVVVKTLVFENTQ